MKVIDKKLLEKVSRQLKCERCGAKTPNGCDSHHLCSKGAGRIDISRNLIGLCRKCHVLAHGDVLVKDECFTIAARREGIPVGEIEAMVWRLRRDDKCKVWVVS